MLGLSYIPFRSPLLRECTSQNSKICEIVFYFPPLTEMFHFSGFTFRFCNRNNSVLNGIGLPHSEICGSKVASHLTAAFRRHATSFIALISQGIHHPPIIINAILPSKILHSKILEGLWLVINNYNYFILFSKFFPFRFVRKSKTAF